MCGEPKDGATIGKYRVETSESGAGVVVEHLRREPGIQGGATIGQSLVALLFVLLGLYLLQWDTNDAKFLREILFNVELLDRYKIAVGVASLTVGVALGLAVLNSSADRDFWSAMWFFCLLVVVGLLGTSVAALVLIERNQDELDRAARDARLVAVSAARADDLISDSHLQASIESLLDESDRFGSIQANNPIDFLRETSYARLDELTNRVTLTPAASAALVATADRLERWHLDFNAFAKRRLFAPVNVDVFTELGILHAASIRERALAFAPGSASPTGSDDTDNRLLGTLLIDNLHVSQGELSETTPRVAIDKEWSDFRFVLNFARWCVLVISVLLCALTGLLIWLANRARRKAAEQGRLDSAWGAYEARVDDAVKAPGVGQLLAIGYRQESVDETVFDENKAVEAIEMLRDASPVTTTERMDIFGSIEKTQAVIASIVGLVSFAVALV